MIISAICLLLAICATVELPAQPPVRGAQGRPGSGGERPAFPTVPRDDEPFSPSNFDAINPELPTLFIASDSTAATGGPTTRGWGAVLIDYFDTSKLNIVNYGAGGRSFRSYTAEGRWDRIEEHLKPGDFVIIELGHNDGGAPDRPPYRGDVPGIGDETVVVTQTRRNGDVTTETVHTYGWYTRKYVRESQAKGAIPIVSTTTVRNIWSQDDKVERGMGQMREWAKQVAEQEHALFLDHSNITADAYEAMGFDDVQKFFVRDHTHTSTLGAIANAEHLIAGLRALKGIDPLLDALNERGRAIEPAPYKDSWATYAPPPPHKGN